MGLGMGSTVRHGQHCAACAVGWDQVVLCGAIGLGSTVWQDRTGQCCTVGWTGQCCAV